MKAVVCTKYGKPEVLQLEDVEKPVPDSNEILIRIVATSVTASDCIIRKLDLPPLMKMTARFALGFRKPRNPILGQVLSGVVEEVGSRIREFEIGEKVFAHTFMKFGAYAEYVCVPEDSCVARMPTNVTFEEAAALPFGGTLSLYYLKKANIQKEEYVLIYGASGSNGTLSIQIAKNYGAFVDGVCSAKNIKLVKSLGADVVYDYTSDNFKLDDQKYDLIFDAVGKKKSARFVYKNALRNRGKFVSVDDDNPGKKAVNKKNLLILKDLAERNVIKPVIDKVYALEQMVEAHRYVDKGHKVGNVIITI